MKELEELKKVFENRIKELEKQQQEFKNAEFNFIGQDISSRILESYMSLQQVQMLIIKTIGK